MIELPIWGADGVLSEQTVEVSKAIFGCDFNETLVHQSVLTYQSNSHQGTKAQKSRSDVKGSTIKPWRQKGTGRARAGTRKSPLWRSGGVTFASRPDQTKRLMKINRKMYRKALCSILSKLVEEKRLCVLLSWEVESPKTSEIVASLQPFDAKRIFLVTKEVSENLYLGMRNLYNAEVSDVYGINPVSLVYTDKLLITQDALKQIEEWLK